MSATPTELVATHAYLDPLEGRLSVPRHGRELVWADQARHEARYDSDPELYALSALDPDATDPYRIQVLLQLLRAPRSVESAPVDRVVAALLALLPDDDVLTVFLALRRARINRKAATRAALRWLLGHPGLAALAARRRPAVRDVLDHALGVASSRACLAAIAAGEPAAHLARFTVDPAVAAWLLHRGPAPLAAPAAPPRSLRVHEERPQTVTVTNRGAISCALVHAWRGSVDEAVRAEVAGAVAARTHGWPRFAGRLALVLDLSASTRGYGDREHAVASQAVALWLCLAAIAPDLHVVPVGARLAEGDRVAAACALRPEGSTDLARALIAAARTEPDAIVVVTDGFESVRSGDLAAVARALPGAGCHAPVEICTVLFSVADDRTHRRPAPALPELVLWHEADLYGVVRRLLSRAGPAGRGFLRDAWLGELRRLEEV